MSTRDQIAERFRTDKDLRDYIRNFIVAHSEQEHVPLRTPVGLITLDSLALSPLNKNYLLVGICGLLSVPVEDLPTYVLQYLDYKVIWIEHETLDRMSKHPLHPYLFTSTTSTLRETIYEFLCKHKHNEDVTIPSTYGPMDLLLGYACLLTASRCRELYTDILSVLDNDYGLASTVEAHGVPEYVKIYLRLKRKTSMVFTPDEIWSV